MFRAVIWMHVIYIFFWGGCQIFDEATVIQETELSWVRGKSIAFDDHFQKTFKE